MLFGYGEIVSLKTNFKYQKFNLDGMRMIERIDETFDYIKAPEYFLAGTVFCVGFGLSLFAMSNLSKETYLWALMLIVGGVGLSIWSGVFGYFTYKDR